MNTSITGQIGVVGNITDAGAQLLNKAIQNNAPPAPPTREQMRDAIRNPETPEVVKRFLKEQLYGPGGNGRKATQQEALKKRAVYFHNQNANEKIDKAVGRPGPPEPLRKPPGMSGRRFRRARKLIRRGIRQVFQK